MTRYRLLDCVLVLTPLLIVSAKAGTPSAEQTHETLLSPSLNAYNPIPSPDGTTIACVATGWTGEGEGRSSLISRVMLLSANGDGAGEKPLAECSFLSAWSADGHHLVCFRDYHACLISAVDVPWDHKGARSRELEIPDNQNYGHTERVGYLGDMDALVWRAATPKGDLLETSDRIIAVNSDAINHLGHLGELLSVSPDGRYIAIPGTLERDTVLWTYDLGEKSWHNLGPITIHPDPNWDYIKPSWNPWSADGSHLAFVSGQNIMLATPDGRSLLSLAKVKGLAGLAVCSPDANQVAYVTFERTPMQMRPDLGYYGGTTLWAVGNWAHSQPVAVTAKSSKQTFDLAWMGNQSLIFDRLGEDWEFKDARLWKAVIPVNAR